MVILAIVLASLAVILSGFAVWIGYRGWVKSRDIRTGLLFFNAERHPEEYVMAHEAAYAVRKLSGKSMKNDAAEEAFRIAKEAMEKNKKELNLIKDLDKGLAEMQKMVDTLQKNTLFIPKTPFGQN